MVITFLSSTQVLLIRNGELYFDSYCSSFCFKAGKGRGMQKIGAWTDKIVNHFWHCCEKAKGDTDVLKVCGICLKAVTSLYFWLF